MPFRSASIHGSYCWILAAARDEFNRRGIKRRLRLVIAGGPSRESEEAARAVEAIHAEVARLGLDADVRLAGSVDDVRPYLAAANALVSASVGLPPDALRTPMSATKSRKPRLALIGSDSLRGKEILSVLSVKKFPLASLELFDPDVEEEYSTCRAA